MAAALRRLIPSLSNSSKSRALAAGLQPPACSNGRKALKVVAAGAMAAAGAAALYYGSVVGVGPRSFQARLVHLALPSVSAANKVQFLTLKQSETNI